MNDTRTSVLGDELGTEDLEAAIVPSFLEKGKERLILFADKSLSFERFKDSVVLDISLFKNVLQSILHTDVHLLVLVVLPTYVVQCRVHSDCHIARQGPWCRGPRNEVCLLTVF